MQPLLLNAVPNIISSLKQGSCQGKLLCVRCLQNLICSFYYIIILNLSVLKVGSFCVSAFGACCLCMLCLKLNCIWKASRQTRQHWLPSPSLSFTVNQNWKSCCNENFFTNGRWCSPPSIWVSSLCRFCLTTYLYLWNWVNCNVMTRKEERKLFY